MRSNVSRCNICGKFFDSKKELKNHVDKNHRITNSKIAKAGRTKPDALSSSIIEESTSYDDEKKFIE